MNLAEDRIEQAALKPTPAKAALIAIEAVALLRRVQEAGYQHPIKCETGCACVWVDVGVMVDEFLDGKPEEGT